MAYDVVLRPGQDRVKVRRPWGVLGLAIITLGIYQFFWWYFVNRELRDLGRTRQAEGLGKHPIVSVLALIGGALVLIPTIWTYVTTIQRIQRAQSEVGTTDRLNGWIVLALAIFTLGIGVNIYMQHHLNKVWESDAITTGQGPATWDASSGFQPPMAGLPG